MGAVFVLAVMGLGLFALLSRDRAPELPQEPPPEPPQRQPIQLQAGRRYRVAGHVELPANTIVDSTSLELLSEEMARLGYSGISVGPHPKGIAVQFVTPASPVDRALPAVVSIVGHNVIVDDVEPAELGGNVPGGVLASWSLTPGTTYAVEGRFTPQGIALEQAAPFLRSVLEAGGAQSIGINEESGQLRARFIMRPDSAMVLAAESPPAPEGSFTITKVREVTA